MKNTKRILALALAIILTNSISMTAFAASSSTTASGDTVSDIVSDLVSDQAPENVPVSIPQTQAAVPPPIVPFGPKTTTVAAPATTKSTTTETPAVVKETTTETSAVVKETTTETPAVVKNTTVETPAAPKETTVETPAPKNTTVETPAAPQDTTVETSDASQDTSKVIASIPTTSSVAGETTKIEGVYLATGVNGTIAVTNKKAASKENKLDSKEESRIIVTDLDVEKSHFAAEVLQTTAKASGMECGPMINISLGKISEGKMNEVKASEENSSDAADDDSDVLLKVGIPEHFIETNKTYAVIEVRSGGAVRIHPDLDNNPTTVTFAIKDGQASYAIVKY